MPASSDVAEDSHRQGPVASRDLWRSADVYQVSTNPSADHPGDETGDDLTDQPRTPRDGEVLLRPCPDAPPGVLMPAPTAWVTVR